jgi:hypothetical protein
MSYPNYPHIPWIYDVFHFFLWSIDQTSCGFHGEFRGFLVGLESHEMWTGWDFDRNVGNL